MRRSPSWSRRPTRTATSYTSLPIAVNADALYGWFVDALAEVQTRHRVVFEVVREDHTRTGGAVAPR